MKNIIRAVLCFVLFFGLNVEKVKALDPIYDIRVDKEFKIMPTNIPVPTSILIKPIKEIEMDIMPLTTKTPTSIVVTQIVTTTPNPTVTETDNKPTETDKITAAPDTKETVTLEPTIEETKTTEEDNKDSSKWFWVIVVGFLILILIVQIWSTRENKEDKDEQDDIQS